MILLDAWKPFTLGLQGYYLMFVCTESQDVKWIEKCNLVRNMIKFENDTLHFVTNINRVDMLDAFIAASLIIGFHLRLRYNEIIPNADLLIELCALFSRTTEYVLLNEYILICITSKFNRRANMTILRYT